MIFFPQLQTGASAQFPLTRTIGLRTAVCQFSDGTVTRVADPGARTVKWTLEYTGLTDSEWTKLSSFFQQTRGRLETFCFLDPFENLLSWSNDPTKPVWTVAPGIQIGLGGSADITLTNTAATTQRISQRLDVPGSFQYCWSLYIKDAPACKLMAECGDGSAWIDVPRRFGWQHVAMQCSFPGTSESVAFGIDLPRDTSVQICNMQVDAQPNAAKPRSTRARSGVFPACRFDQDQLSITSAGPNDHATTVHIISNLSL